MKAKCLLMSVMFLWFSHTTALTFQAIVLSDEIDNNPGDGICEVPTGFGLCCLRAAVLEANALGGTHTIELAEGVHNLSILGDDDAALMGDVDITNADITVIGLGAGATINANGNNRIFQVFNGRSLSLENLVLTGGRAGTASNNSGGAISVSGTGTQLFTNQVTITNNSANIGGGLFLSNATDVHITDTTFLDNNTEDLGFVNIWGPAIFCSDCELTITGSSFISNDMGGKAIQLDGGDLFMTNSTMTENEGGGIRTSNANAVIRFSTFVSSSGQNVSHFSFDDSHVVDIGGSVLFTPAAAFLDNCQAGDKPISSGYNIISDESCEFMAVGDSESTDAQLNAISDNGGFTATFLPSSTSPAINLVPISACETAGGDPLLEDQRGLTRPDGALCDAGSVEVNSDVIFATGFE